MRERDIKTAKKFGILARCQAFERDLLQIKDIIFDASEDGVSFDLNGFLDDIFQVIIVPQYGIKTNRDDYWEARKTVKESVITLAEKYDLRQSGDQIEDYGEHFYFVFDCGPTWTNRL